VWGHPRVPTAGWGVPWVFGGGALSSPEVWGSCVGVSAALVPGVLPGLGSCAGMGLHAFSIQVWAPSVFRPPAGGPAWPPPSTLCLPSAGGPWGCLGLPLPKVGSPWGRGGPSQPPWELWGGSGFGGVRAPSLGSDHPLLGSAWSWGGRCSWGCFSSPQTLGDLTLSGLVSPGASTRMGRSWTQSRTPSWGEPPLSSP